MSIYRYDEMRIVITPLDPLEDICSWIRGLRSRGYTSDLLADVHQVGPSKEVRAAASLSSAFADHAVGLLDQAYSGPPEVSYLPLYYALLNLAKIYIVAAGRRQDLRRNRHHGVTYPHKQSHGLLTETIRLRDDGVVPLFYEVLTNSPWHFGKRRMALADLYPYVWGIGHEYEQVYKKAIAYQGCDVEVEGDAQQGYNLTVALGRNPTDLTHPYEGDPHHLKLLTGLTADPQRPDHYLSRQVHDTEDQARERLVRGLRRFLLRSTLGQLRAVHTMTPISKGQLLLPSELPILFAFFHLGSVVRYNPEFLSALADSKAWGLLLPLRKHAVLEFLRLFWCYMNQSEYLITHS